MKGEHVRTADIGPHRTLKETVQLTMNYLNQQHEVRWGKILCYEITFVLLASPITVESRQRLDMKEGWNGRVFMSVCLISNNHGQTTDGYTVQVQSCKAVVLTIKAVEKYPLSVKLSKSEDIR